MGLNLKGWTMSIKTERKKIKAKLKSASKGKVKPSKEAKPIGRPTVMTDNTVNKLEQAFAMGCGDEEACLFAGITKTTLYKYIETHPDFTDRKEMLKKNPVLKARQVLLNHLALDDKDIAKYVVDKHDGKAKQSVDVSGEMTNYLKVAIVEFSDDRAEDDKDEDGGQD